MIDYLKPMYSKVEDITPLDAVQSQLLYPYHNSLESVLDFFIKSNPVAIINQAAGETNASYAVQMNDYTRNVIREFCLRTF